MAQKVKITFLYDDLCASKDETWKNLNQALEEVDVKAEIEKINVLDYAQRTFRYYPSPTILINGEDVFKEGSLCNSSCGAG
jgi:transglutaminase-like putative cysteine protease